MAKKQLFTLEYPVRCSPTILYGFLATPSGLGEWFADKVDEHEGILSFFWNGVAEKAERMEDSTDSFVRYRWLSSAKDEYFEFRIITTEISNQTILIINDFAEKGDIKDQTALWEYQVKELIHRLGG
jgi:hypothetical protein